MQLQPIPFYYPVNTPGIIQTAAASGVGPPHNMVITQAGSSAGPVASGPPPMYYQYAGNSKRIIFFSIGF
jgi:hypothetical protein